MVQSTPCLSLSPSVGSPLYTPAINESGLMGRTRARIPHVAVGYTDIGTLKKMPIGLPLKAAWTKLP